MGKYGTDVSLPAEHIFTATVQIAEPYLIGDTPKGLLKVIPITGGTVVGEQVNGKVLPLGADWNTAMTDGSVRNILARYIIQTDDGALISVENEGWKSAVDSEVTNAVAVPRFQTGDERYAWMNHGVYFSTLAPVPGSAVQLKFYRLK